MRTADKSKPTLNHMVQAFRNYMKTNGKTSASFEQVVMSKDGLGWEGTYSEWYNGNKHRNMTKIFTDWQTKKTPDGFHFVKVRRGYYFPSQGDGIRKFAFRSPAAKASAPVAKPVEVPSAVEIPAKPAANPADSLVAKLRAAVTAFTDLANELDGICRQ